jgi:hypothetical protein
MMGPAFTFTFATFIRTSSSADPPARRSSLAAALLLLSFTLASRVARAD